MQPRHIGNASSRAAVRDTLQGVPGDERNHHTCAGSRPTSIFYVIRKISRIV